MSVKSISSIPGHESVVRTAYLKKLKTSKKKFFVLRAEAPESSARLEYYDSEKKFNNGQAPKRSIPLKTCFNINKRVDTKYKHVIALYTKVDCFCIVLENEEELDAWLKDLLSLQHGEEAADGEMPRPTFEHVWQVTILNRGLGGNSVLGAYNKGIESPTFRLCLTDKTLSLIRKDKNTPQAELSLSSIRSCGSLKNYVYLEVGRSSVTGSGELWMETEDGNIAQNVHETIFHAMSTSSSSKEELAPKSRYRSSSATEASKPSGRKQTHSGSTKHYSQDVNPQIVESSVPVSTSSTHIAGASSGARERCDSMPSRARTSSEGTHPIHTWIQARSHLTAHRPQSLYVRDISHSPPVESPISPPSGACSTDSAGSSLSIDDPDQWCETDTILSRYSHSLTPDEAIAEENYDECPDSPCLQQGSSPSGYVPMAPISSDDGYVDMSPRGRHAAMSPAASFSSVTSGTPSTDMRFIDYPLEKVSAYFTPSEEDTAMSDRPIRAYSVGSRPDAISNKTKLDMSSTFENARVRAFSVGSKSRKILTRVLPPHGSLVHPKPKSSSAPVLTGSRTLLNQNSDLMEMDFSKPSPSTSGYMDMTPKGYMEMRPGLPFNSLIQSTPPDYLPMHPGPKIVTAKLPQQEYVDMSSSKYNKIFGSSPKYPSTDSAIEVSSDYMDMDYHQSPKPTTSEGVYHQSSKPRTSDGYFHQSSKPSISDSYYHQSPKSSATEGYVEMTLGRSSHQRQSSLDHDDYTDMTMGSKKSNRKDTKSQPITIHASLTTTTSTTQFPKGSSSISPVYSSLHVGRKYSAGTYMPITSSNNTNSFSSLPRQRSRKNSRNDSRDSSSSSTTTPSSSSMQFPLSLNSPTSPLKPQTSKPPEPQLTGTIKVPQAVMNVKYNRSNDYTSMDFGKSRDYVNYTPSPLRSGTESSNFADYVAMKPKLESAKAKQENENDYARTRPRLDSGDYAVMRPGFDSGEHSKMQSRANSGEHAVIQSRGSSGEHAIIQPRTNSAEHAIIQPRANSGGSAIIQPQANSGERTIIQPRANSGEHAIMQSRASSAEHAVIQPRATSGEHTMIQSRTNSGEHAIMQPHANSANYTMMHPRTGSGDYTVMRPGADTGDYAVMRPRTDSGDYAIMRPGTNSGDYTLMEPRRSGGDYAVMRPGSLDITRNVTEPISSSTLTTQLSSMVLARIGGDLSAARCFIPISESQDVTMSPRPGDIAPSKPQEDSVYECMSPVAKISRPNSENSERRPNSTSSELGSSSSTLVGSRPGSVSCESVRPASVNIEGQLHYASLDLAPTTEEDCNRSPRTSKPEISSNTSPTQTIPENGASGFTYAEIDFIKSDGFKQALPNAKVKN